MQNSHASSHHHLRGANGKLILFIYFEWMLLMHIKIFENSDATQ